MKIHLNFKKSKSYKQGLENNLNCADYLPYLVEYKKDKYSIIIFIFI